MAKILKAPDGILSQKAQPVAKISAKVSQRRPTSGMGGPAFGWDKKTLRIIEEMKEALRRQDNPRGVGLAAPQIGYPLRIFVTKPFPKSPLRVFINPEITWRSKELTSGVPERENPLEGCLSLPGIWGRVQRHAALKLRYLTPDGKTHHGLFKGFSATIIQHEIDHLEGRLFPQRVLKQKGKLYRSQKDKEGKGRLVEIELT